MTALDTRIPDASRLRLQGDAARAQSSGPLLVLFIITILTPASFELAGFLLSPTRLFLLVATVPFALKVMSGQAGRFTIVDLFFLLHGVWIIISLTVIEGPSRIPFAGITAVELTGGYFVGRVLVQDAIGYRRLFRIILIALLVLMPFVLIELITGKLVIPDLLRPYFETPFRGRSAYGRLGMERVYGVFDHPILWGLFCSLTLANFVALARGNLVKIGIGVGLSLFTTMMALSSAPLLACLLQLGLLGWAWISRGRWKALIIITAVLYVGVDLLSARTPVTILIDSLTFNPLTGYTRIAIFDAGWAAVQSSPIFGIGFNDWPRPHWLTSSVDNFWLLTSMRYGIVGAVLLLVAFVAHIWLLSRATLADPEVAAIRIGHAVALIGISLTIVTVHIWGNMSVFTMFYLGAGAWMYASPQAATAPDAAGEAGDGPAPQPQAARYSRFAPNAREPQTGSPASAGTEPESPEPQVTRAGSLRRSRFTDTTPRKDSTA